MSAIFFKPPRSSSHSTIAKQSPWKSLFVWLALTIQLLFSSVAGAVPGDENWSDEFKERGFDGVIWATVADSVGNVYVGGLFSSVDGVPVSNIARWDGNSWSALGSGLTGNSSYVKALEIDSNGVLYAGGNFRNAGGDKNADQIAKWDGNSWSALGDGLNGSVSSMALDNNDVLYVGGSFSDAGGDADADGVSKWDGGSWSALGDGLTGSIEALATDDLGFVYAGGYFEFAGGNADYRVAKWDGSIWTILGPVFNDYVRALAVDKAGSLYVGGSFNDAGGNGNADYVAQWNGSTWMPLASGLSDAVLMLETDRAGTLLVGGGFDDAGGNTSANGIATWDGSSWAALGSGVNGNGVYAVTFDDSGNLFAGGGFHSVGHNTDAKRIAKWNGSHWSEVAVANLPPEVVLQGLNGDVHTIVSDGTGGWYVGGDFVNAGGDSDADYIARWSNGNWHALGVGLHASVRALALQSGGKLYVGGDFLDAGGHANADYIALWDGSSWTPLGVGLKDSVHALAIDSGSGSLYVGGAFTDASGNVAADYVAHWTGSGWLALGSGLNGVVRAFAFDTSGGLYVGGDFTNAGGNSSADYVAHWSGGSWLSLGGGLSNSVYALVYNRFGELYAGGRFLDAGGVFLADKIAQWNGSNWLSLGWSLNSTVQALVLDSDDRLYVGGAFSNVDGVSAALKIARYDGGWSALGSGATAGNVNALAFDDAAGLMVGGSFSGAGDKASSKIAHWREPKISHPADGANLSGDTQVFTWSASGADVTEWQLEITDPGTGQSFFNISGLRASSLQSTATGLPVDGKLVTATLSYLLQGDSTWYSTSANYLAASESTSAITNPEPGSVLTGDREVFHWNDIAGAVNYRLWVGSTAGGSQYGKFSSATTSTTVAGLPTDGSTVYVTLKWRDTTWHAVPTVSYTAYTEVIGPVITSPVDGDTLSGTSANFEWTGTPAAANYRLWVGSTSGGAEYGKFSSTGTNTTVTGLPDDGSTVYVTLKWRDTKWHAVPVVSYTAYTDIGQPEITSPVAGSTFTGANVDFQWNRIASAVNYRLWIGSTSGGAEYGKFSSTGTSRTVAGLPIDGSTVYVTLKWRDTSWHTVPTVSYTAANLQSVFISPLAGTTLSSGTATFEWNAIAGATNYRVWMGSTAGGAEFGKFSSTSTTRTVTGLPTDGSTVYATLKWHDGSWNAEPSVSFATGP